MTIATIGLDLAKHLFQVHGVDERGKPGFRKQLRRNQVAVSFATQHALNLVQCDIAVSPTGWQRSRHPQILQPKIVVQHEGIDTRALGPDPAASFVAPNGTVLKAGDPVITYVARNLEPYRGFHIFMRALQRIQKAHPRCHAIVVGADGASYGARPKDAPNWREKMLREAAIDPLRTHFMGRLPRVDYLRVLQVSAAHVYLTYPFVLSWSMLEAMASGALIVGSDTAPVREVIRDGANGRLVDFFDAPAIAQTVLKALAEPESEWPLREQAKLDAQRYGREASLAGYDRLIGVPAA